MLLIQSPDLPIKYPGEPEFLPLAACSHGLGKLSPLAHGLWGMMAS